MTIPPKDRRGLGEIVAVASITVAVAGVIVAQLLRGGQVDNSLMGAFVGLLLVVSGRGIQSASERGASSEFRTREAAELREAKDEFRREAAAIRRVLTDVLLKRLPPLDSGTENDDDKTNPT